MRITEVTVTSSSHTPFVSLRGVLIQFNVSLYEGVAMSTTAFMLLRFFAQTTLFSDHSPSPFRALVSRKYSSKHHHHCGSSASRSSLNFIGTTVQRDERKYFRTDESVLRCPLDFSYKQTFSLESVLRFPLVLSACACSSEVVWSLRIHNPRLCRFAVF